MLVVNPSGLTDAPFEVCSQSLLCKRLLVMRIFKWAWRVKQLNGPVSEIIKVARVCDIVLITAVNVITFLRLTTTIASLRLILNVK